MNHFSSPSKRSKTRAAALGLTVLAATALFPQAPNARAFEPAAQGAQTAGIEWQPSFEAALARAKTSGLPVMIDFGAVWCGACREMERQTYSDPKVVAASRDFVMVRIDVDRHPDIADHYGVSSLPATAWLRADTHPIAGVVGALEPRDLLAAMREATKRAQKSK